jgi:hypothetical protein
MENDGGSGNVEPEQTAMFYRWELILMGSEINVYFLKT